MRFTTTSVPLIERCKLWLLAYLSLLLLASCQENLCIHLCGQELIVDIYRVVYRKQKRDKT